MNRPIIKDMAEFKKLCQPIADYLHENADPYIEVHITTERIIVTSDECRIPFINPYMQGGQIE